MSLFSPWTTHLLPGTEDVVTGENIACDVDEVLWPDLVQRHDAKAELMTNSAVKM